MEPAANPTFYRIGGSGSNLTCGPAPTAAFAVVPGLAVLVALAPKEELGMIYLIPGVVFWALVMSPF